MNRFARQTILTGFGTAGQQKLTDGRVLVVGAGGLGSPALLHLAAAGVGTIGIADGDSVSESNLNRQTLFGHQDVGKPKAATAAEVLQEKYPDIRFRVFPEFLTPENALDIIEQFDVVLDGSDNFGTRYMINDACVLLKKPLVMGAIYQYEGQLSVFNYGEDPVNYRDIYPTPPDANEIPNCSETGVIGVLPGIIGSLQAAEAIKVLSGLGEILSNRILFYNLKTSGFYEIRVGPDKEAGEAIPGDADTFRKKDYNVSCGVAQDISWEKALDWAYNQDNSLLIDIREPGEEPEWTGRGVKKIPMNALRQEPQAVKDAEHILLFCRSGQRSSKLAQELKSIFPEKKNILCGRRYFRPCFPFKNRNR